MGAPALLTFTSISKGWILKRDEARIAVQRQLDWLKSGGMAELADPKKRASIWSKEHNMIGNFPDHVFMESFGDDPNDPDAVCYKPFKFEYPDGSSHITQCGHTRKEHQT
jgi:hypothetical protein